ncbi:MAG TPA: DUF3108 domain-containing protein [Pyrinomonadaceae bacterium]|nr:DUF3108 domain-containing protein [Pyrinomonadaceae bacterium]
MSLHQQLIQSAAAVLARAALFTLNVAAQQVGIFRVGEKLTYNVSIDSFDDAGYAETYVVSVGKLGERDAVELRSRFRTLNFASAAFYMVDETRTTFASPETGLPIFSRREERSGGLPKVKTADHQAVPATGHDLNTLIFAIRAGGAAGSFTLNEFDRVYSVSYQTTGNEKVSSSTGDFETTLIGVQSDFLMERGIRDLQVNLTSDPDRIPAQVRFATDKGSFKAVISGIRVVEPVPDPETIPNPIATPLPSPVATPVPTPAPYIPNQPLAATLPFALGESLEYVITTSGAEIGRARFRIERRDQFSGRDALLLTATVTPIGRGSAAFAAGDSMQVWVDPDTLTPIRSEIKAAGPLSIFNSNALFDTASSVITINGAERIDGPVWTHSVLSLLYAMRSFNLRPSLDSNAPVNDTRVAVFWHDRATVFTLRPSESEVIDASGVKLPAQLVNINPNHPQLDQLMPRVWLGNTPQRLPLRIALGQYQLDLSTTSTIPPK